MNKMEKREMLLSALQRFGGFASLSVRIDCAIPNLVAYASGIAEVPPGLLATLQELMDSGDPPSRKS